MIAAVIINIIFLIFPLFYGVIISFYEVSPIRPFEEIFTYNNYIYVINTYGYIIVRTMQMSLILTILLIALSLPIAYYLAVKVKSDRVKTLILFIMLIPFWIDWSARVMAWHPVLGDMGFINYVIRLIGLEPVKLIFTSYAVMIAWAQTYILFMITPIYLSLLKLDPTIIMAAETLGAKKRHIFYHIIFKMALPGIAVGSIYTFVMSMSDYATPAIVGGGYITLGSVIASLSAFLKWPLAMALAMVQVLLLLIFIFLILKVVDIRRMLF
jgi:ABC-type spermidine/putrescine transport system permease subunit I